MIDHNHPVQTPNGPALAFQMWQNLDDPDGDYLVVRHPKPKRGEEDTFDPALAAYVFSKTAVDGWLAAYKLEEVT